MSRLLEELQNKEYRDAFVASEINIGVPYQTRSLREGRGWTQQELADRAGMKQPRISAIEQPGGSRLNLGTLRRLASAFDCALIVHFAPFSKLVDWARNFSPDEFQVPSFEEDFAGSTKEPDASNVGLLEKVVVIDQYKEDTQSPVEQRAAGLSRRIAEREQHALSQSQSSAVNLAVRYG
jgi:transcriptional regulator with XRE-family HTH domain